MIAWLENTPIGNSRSCARHCACMSTVAEPSMKLLSKERDGKKVHCVYDPAKTTLQRLLLSGVLHAQKQQELIEEAQRSTLSACFNNWSSCNRPSSAVPQVALLLFQAYHLPPQLLFRGRLYSRKVSCREEHL